MATHAVSNRDYSRVPHGAMTLFLGRSAASVFLIGLPVCPEDGSEDASCAALAGDETNYEVPLPRFPGT